MQIQSGKLYKNKTWLYLYPCLKLYGQDLRKQLNSFLKLGVGISDHNLNIENGFNNIYILFDTEPVLQKASDVEIYKQNFSKFLDWLKYQHYYETDYVFEELKHSGKHMVVLKIPAKHDKAIMNFIQGKYSEMYVQRDLNEYFAFITNPDKDFETKQNAKLKKVRDVLTKNKEALPEYVKTVNELYGTEITVEDYKEAEIDFPPTLEDETFNY